MLSVTLRCRHSVSLLATQQTVLARATRRGLHTTDASRGPISSSKSKSTRGITVTKKKYSELPKRITAAEPVDAAARATDQCKSGDASASLDDAPVTKRKPRTRAKTTTQTDAQSDATAETEAPLKRRRSRKLTMKDDADPPVSSVSIPSKPSQPRNMLATEILANLERFPHCILLTRVGQFYESYFDQAVDVARLLNIKLTSRVWDKKDIPMCGFPIMHLERYLKILVQQHNLFVAMCEEYPRRTEHNQKPEFERRVARVITPGTLIDEPFLNHFENNYLLAVNSVSDANEPAGDLLGLAWIDVSTGEFFTKTCPSETLKDEVTRIGPREVVLDSSLQSDSSHSVRRAVDEDGHFVSYAPASTLDSETLVPTNHIVDDVVASEDSKHEASIYTAQEAGAISILTSYLRVNLLEHMPTLTMPSRDIADTRMQIDSHTIKALEIRETSREGGTRGSLMSVVKRTVTSGGTRLLSRWLCSPSTSIKEIQARQSLVEFFYTRPHLLEDIKQLLMELSDTSRIVQKFLLLRGDPSDLLALQKTVAVWNSIQERIQLERDMEGKEKATFTVEDWQSIETLMSRMHDLSDLSDRIKAALHNYTPPTADQLSDDPDADSDVLKKDAVSSATTKFEGQKWTINPDFSPALKNLHQTLNDLLDRRVVMGQELQLEYSAPSLILRSSPIYGLHAHIGRKRDAAKVKSSPLFQQLSESASTSTFFYQPWYSLGAQITETTTTITETEKEAFRSLRDEVAAFAEHIRRNSRIMDELDVTIGFARLAKEMRFVKPQITDDVFFNIVDGRHPTVEKGLLAAGRVFTPNSIEMTDASRLQVITGPNMAGKSTVLRQVALIALLAQTGSFVPAEFAVVGIVDRLFSRVGAKDDLYRDRSTFMVEMLETAEILRRATPRSLVIMDEVGRGTTVKDGLAIAFATVYHLLTVNRSRALFATHFHELADILGYNGKSHKRGPFKGISFHCTGIEEVDDKHFTYSHRLKPGVNRDSHGLKVAQLAGMPDSVVTLAEEALSVLRERELLDASELTSLGKTLTSPYKKIRSRLKNIF